MADTDRQCPEILPSGEQCQRYARHKGAPDTCRATMSKREGRPPKERKP